MQKQKRPVRPVLPRTADPTHALVNGQLLSVSVPRISYLDLAHMDGEVMTRFKQKIDDSAGPTGCWTWTGSVHKDGYGGLWTPYGMIRAHRLMYRAVAGQVPTMALDKGRMVDVIVGHTCHDEDLACKGGTKDPHRLCVNPRHLALQTRVENVLRGHRWMELAA